MTQQRKFLAPLVNLNMLLPLLSPKKVFMMRDNTHALLHFLAVGPLLETSV